MKNIDEPNQTLESWIVLSLPSKVRQGPRGPGQNLYVASMETPDVLQNYLASFRLLLVAEFPRLKRHDGQSSEPTKRKEPAKIYSAFSRTFLASAMRGFRRSAEMPRVPPEKPSM